MSPPDALPRRRRPLLVPVVIATIFLSIIGATAGIVLGARADQRAAAAGESGSSGFDTPAGGTPPTSGGSQCRPETQEQGRRAGAVGLLRVELVLRTRTSTVWICADEADRRYYHANRNSDGDVWVENKTALFLTGVIRVDGGYRAGLGDQTVFFVFPGQLVIEHHDGRKEVQPAVEQ